MANSIFVPGPLSANGSPFTFPIIWDSISLGGGAFTWSGKVQFVGAKRSYNWQIKVPPGMQGEQYAYRGLITHPFRMRLEVWTEAQWQLLPGLLAFFTYDALKPNPNGTANPVDIYHPALAAIDISQVFCEAIEAPEVDQERSGAAWWTFVLREFRAIPTPQNVTSTPQATQVPIVVLNASGGTLGQTISTQAAEIQNEAASLPTTLP